MGVKSPLVFGETF